jgi:hypothetical protein
MMSASEPNVSKKELYWYAYFIALWPLSSSQFLFILLVARKERNHCSGHIACDMCNYSGLLVASRACGGLPDVVRVVEALRNQRGAPE